MKHLKLYTIIFLLFGFQKSNAQKDSISVSPNPFGGATTIYFEFEESDTASLNIFNAIGQNVRKIFNDSFIQKGKHSIYFERNGLPNGMYFVSLTLSSRKSITAKMIIVDKASTDKFLKESPILIYPNPIKDFFIIDKQNFEGKITKISLFDILGKEIKLDFFNLENPVIQLNIPNIDKGNYILKIQTEQGIISKKITKTQ